MVGDESLFSLRLENNLGDRLSYLVVFAGIMLTALGVLEIYAASASRADEQFADPYLFLRKQLIVFVVALVLVFVVQRLPIRYLNYLPLPLLLIAVGGLVLLLVPGLTFKVGLATRWLNIFGLSFQPAELAKISLIFYLAKNLSRPACDLTKLKYLGQCLLPLFIIGGLIMWQPDFGTTFLLVIICLALLFVGGLNRKYLLLFSCFGVAFSATAIYLAPYRFKRLLSFIDPWSQLSDGGFQIVQSYLAFQNGGLLGVGLGESKQKLFFLPEAHSDFILSVIGEELGILGVFFVWGLFFYLCYLGFTISLLVRDQFCKFLAFGITALITSQALFNMGVVIGLLPTKGLPLPFVSSGASSLIVFFLALAILARLAREIPEPEEGLSLRTC